MGKFVTRLRPGDVELQDRIFTEAHRLYDNGVPLSEAISRLLELAGDNPNAFNGTTRKNIRGLNKTDEGRAVLRLVGTASTTRDIPGVNTGIGWWPHD